MIQGSCSSLLFVTPFTSLETFGLRFQHFRAPLGASLGPHRIMPRVPKALRRPQGAPEDPQGPPTGTPGSPRSRVASPIIMTLMNGPKTIIENTETSHHTSPTEPFRPFRPSALPVFRPSFRSVLPSVLPARPSGPAFPPSFRPALSLSLSLYIYTRRYAGP